MRSILVLKRITKGIPNAHDYISIYSQVSSIEKVGGGYEVLIVKQGTAIPLYSNPGIMGIQERTSVSDEDTKIEKKWKI